MKKIKPPKYPTLYMWEQTNAIAIWYPDGTCEILRDNVKEWEKGQEWFSSGTSN